MTKKICNCEKIRRKNEYDNGNDLWFYFIFGDTIFHHVKIWIRFWLASSLLMCIFFFYPSVGNALLSVPVLNFNHLRREIGWEIQRQIAIEMEQYVNHLIFLFESIFFLFLIVENTRECARTTTEKKLCKKHISVLSLNLLFKPFTMQIWLYHIFFLSIFAMEWQKFQSQTEETVDWIFEEDQHFFSVTATNQFWFQFHWSNSTMPLLCHSVFSKKKTSKLTLGKSFFYHFISDGIQINCYRSCSLCFILSFFFSLSVPLFLFFISKKDNFSRLIVNAINGRNVGKYDDFMKSKPLRGCKINLIRGFLIWIRSGSVRLKFYKRFSPVGHRKFVIFSEN